ncbi:MAG: acyltransferase family protein [Vicinamibacterales bacterium]
MADAIRPKARINELDLLRLSAALAVVMYHYSFRGAAADGLSVMSYGLLAPYAKYGYLGVQLFFMISGFVILMTAASGSLRRFVVSRIVRLYPAFWACCTITFAASVLFGAAVLRVSAAQYAVNMSMLSGFVGVPSVDGVYWSLFVEMRFYALVAIVLLFGRIHRAELLIAFWLSVSIVSHLVHIPGLHFLFITDYSPYFIAGAMYYIVWTRGMTAFRAAVLTTAWLLGIWQEREMLPAMYAHYHTHLSPYAVAAIVTVFFAVMGLVSTGRTGIVGRRKWVLAGGLTYPLYLLHQIVGYMIFNSLYRFTNTHLLFWGTIAVMLACAFCIHVGIEKRFSPALKKTIERAFDHLDRRFARVPLQLTEPAVRSSELGN